MKSIWKRVLSLVFALTVLVSSCLTGLLAVSAAESEEFAEKWVIHNGGTSGTKVTRSANTHMEWSKRDFGLQLPKKLKLDKLGLYIRVTLDQAAANVMNMGGSIELAQQICDQAEISIGIQTVEWRVGLNEVVIPIGANGGYTDGTQGHFDMYKTINWFRFYTTPGSANLSQNSSITIWEVAVVDSTAIGMEFGTSDAYLQLSEPIGGTPNTIEASVKTDAVQSEWSIGLSGAARYNTDIMIGTNGTATAADEQSYGIPEGTAWVGATVHKGGFYGTKDQKFPSVSIPKRYGIDDLALSFWLYVSDPTVVSKMASYIELTSSGKCDNEELEWNTYGSAFANLKTGWNRIVLPFSTATRNGGTINLANLNFLRIWGNQGAQHVATTDVDIRFSEMTVITVGAASEEETSSLEMVDGLPTWKLIDFTKMPHNWDKGVMTVGNVWENDGTDALQPADGTTYMEVKPGSTLVFESNHANPGKEYWKGGFGANTTNAFIAPNIPSQYTVNDLKFTFWMYVPEADLVPLNQTESPNFEFTSDGNEDGAQLEKRFLLRDAGGLKDGWNYLEMPLSSMSASGGFDLYNINYLRWSFMCTFKDQTGTVDECIRYADFRIAATVNKGVEEQKTVVDTDTIYNIVSNAGAAADQTVALYLTEQGNVGFTWGEKQYVTSFNAMTGDWIDLALVRDMSKSKFLLYANGEVVAELDATGTKDIVPTVAHAIAADPEGKSGFSGWIADVRMWNDVRTAEEIKNNRTPKKGVDNNGFGESTEGLLGSWILMGSTQDLFIKQSDVSKYHNDAVVRSSRADQWEDYVVPTDVIGEDYYTMVFIPDTQNLVTGKYTAEWVAAAQWIADNIEEENIVHVIGAGDTTWNDTIPEYDRAMLGWDLFTDKVSWSNMIGNHDYPWKNNTMTIRDSTNYNTYFGEKYVKSTMGDTYFVEYYDDPYGLSKMENAYYRMEINGVPWMILQIEYHPRVCVIEWADSILKQYPDDNVILTTHGYIGNDNAAYCTHWMTYTKEDANNGGYIGSLLTPPVEWHYPALDGQNDQSNEKPIWDKLIYPNANVKMLLCGHASTKDGHVLTRWDKNAAGNIVPQTMINGQDVDETYFPNHAMGMLGILRFSADGTKCEIQYYSPYHGSSYHPSNQEMRSLTLAINGTEQGGDVTEPDVPVDPDAPIDPDAPVDPDTPTDPDTPDEGGVGASLWIVIAAVAVVAIAVVAVVLIKKKK